MILLRPFLIQVVFEVAHASDAIMFYCPLAANPTPIDLDALTIVIEEEQPIVAEGQPIVVEDSPDQEDMFLWQTSIFFHSGRGGWL